MIIRVKNRNIRAYVNFISMTRSTDFCFKTTYVSMFLRFRSIICCFQCFVRGSPPFGKVVSHETPLPLRNYCPWTPPLPSEFPMVFRGGVWIFSGTTQLQSNLVKNFDSLIWANRLSVFGNGCVTHKTLSLSLVRSTHMQILPSGFGTTTMPAHQLVGMSTFEMMPRLSILCSSSLTFGMRGSATRLVVVIA